MKTFMIAMVALLTAAIAQAHQWTPTYPEFRPAYVNGVLITTMTIFNKRSDVRFYEINVYDEDWNTIRFATTSKIIEVGYLERINVDVFILEQDLVNVEYICTTSKLLADDLNNGIHSKICSKV